MSHDLFLLLILKLSGGLTTLVPISGKFMKLPFHSSFLFSFFFFQIKAIYGDANHSKINIITWLHQGYWWMTDQANPKQYSHHKT